MMIDFALEAEREEHKPPEEAIFQACLLRFRPIMMTTMAALLGGYRSPLIGTGAELRRPLGITIVGGLLLSQLLTLYTTPVVYFRSPGAQVLALQDWQSDFRGAHVGGLGRTRDHEHFGSIYPASDRHVLVGGGAVVRNSCVQLPPCGFLPRMDFPRSVWARASGERIRRPWHLWWQHRWSDSSDELLR
jgi:hypothetical protein